MAKDKIAMQYDLRQNNNSNSTANGKWYPQVVRISTLSLRGLADHITDHGSVYTKDTVYGVLMKFTSCLVELVQQGVAVKLDGLGTFYPTLEAEGAETPVDYNIDTYLHGVHIRFLPEGVQNENITSRELKKKVSLSQRMIFDRLGKPKRVKDGQLVDYGENTPQEP